MNPSDPQSPTDAQLDSSKARPGRHPALGAEERKEIVELSKRGCSRRSIARRLGCSAQTIARTADRDPDFARQLAPEPKIQKALPESREPLPR